MTNFETVSAERFAELEKIKRELNKLSHSYLDLLDIYEIAEAAFSKYTINPSHWPREMKDDPSIIAREALLKMYNIVHKTMESVECKNASDATNQKL